MLSYKTKKWYHIYFFSLFCENQSWFLYFFTFRKNIEFTWYTWPKIEDWKNIRLNALPAYDDRYIKIKVRTFGDNVYTNFCGLNVPEVDIEYESFTVISIDSLLIYDKKYLGNCHYWLFNGGFKF